MWANFIFLPFHNDTHKSCGNLPFCQTYTLEMWMCANLDISMLCAFSSQCSHTVRSSCRSAIVLSTQMWGSSPTPWSISFLKHSRLRLVGSILACRTASTQRACSNRCRSASSSGNSTSSPEPSSSTVCRSEELGISTARRSLLCSWNCLTRLSNAYRKQERVNVCDLLIKV